MIDFFEGCGSDVAVSPLLLFDGCGSTSALPLAVIDGCVVAVSPFATTFSVT